MINLVAGQRYYIEAEYKENLFGDHFSVAWQKPGSGNYTLMLCQDLEPFSTATHNLDITVETSQTSVPTSGALVEYRVTLTNSSSAELGAVPIQIQSITDSKHGVIADNTSGWTPSFWENTCWWWIPELWVGQSWTCSYTRWVSGPGELHDVTVTGLATDGTALSEVATIEYIGDVGPGVKSTDVWAADTTAVIQEQTQLIDTDGDMDIDFDPSLADIRDTEGILIGDYDFDGVCDMWQAWWLRNCIPLSTAEIQAVLANNNSTDMRDKTLRSLTATWLNIAAGNEYECADMRTAINLSLIWLNDNGNPLNGGSPILASSYTWTSFEYAQVWLDWYNSTGGNYCAASQTGGTPTCGSTSQEAEIGTIVGNRMEVVSDATANAGAYLHTPNSKRSKWRISDFHRTDYCVYIPADGYYVIDAWVRTPQRGRDNSFFVRFNNGDYALWDTAKDQNNFVYDQVSSRSDGGATVRWYLTQGEHTLKIHLRENGTQIDRFDVRF
ncbi:MAG TPA: hypothetical protein ENJ56_04325, partial [Anaerolineae bacterium]|nr:hypothetical protein [Anaerolineae bacterium]